MIKNIIYLIKEDPKDFIEGMIAFISLGILIFMMSVIGG